MTTEEMLESMCKDGLDVMLNGGWPYKYSCRVAFYDGESDEELFAHQSNEWTISQAVKNAYENVQKSKKEWGESK